MLFQWGCPSFHFLIHNFNLTYSPALTYSNISLLSNASFHFPIYIFNVDFLLHLITFSSLRGMSTLIFELEVLLVAQLVRVLLFTKNIILEEGLDVPSFFCFCPFSLCSVFQIPPHSASSIDLFGLYPSKEKFHPYII